MTSTEALRLSPLDAAHQALGAKFAEFGGWNMPLQYPSGTIAEHMACRTSCAMFDVSHLGTVRVTGPDAFALLNRSFTNDLGKIAPGRAQYTHSLDPVDAGVVDDIIVWWVSAERFDVMPNASNTSRIVAAIGGRDVTSDRAVIAVQGPSARSIISAVLPDAAGVAHFGVQEFSWRGIAGVVAGTGYTGEAGVELAVPAESAPAVWDALLAAGAIPAGLGARDTLRLEAALPLHGHELGAEITSLQAGLGWVVSWTKGDFAGRAPLLREKEAGVSRRLRGLATADRRPPRAGQKVIADGREIGEITSGNFSPVLQHGIALGFLAPEIVIGTPVAIDMRGTLVPAEVVATPFVKKQS